MAAATARNQRIRPRSERHLSRSFRITIKLRTPPAASARNILATAGRYKAMTALLLLAPGTPMLFQGQEFAATTPFLYFCDHQAELAKTGP